METQTLPTPAPKSEIPPAEALPVPVAPPTETPPPVVDEDDLPQPSGVPGGLPTQGFHII